MPLSTWVERTKQNLHLGDKTFKPTPNVRNPKMLEEADEFARHMTTYRNQLIKYERVMSSFLATLPQVCRANLPRVWEAVEGTSMCEPTSPEISSAHPARAGGEYDELLMVDAAEILRRRMENIVRPIDRWLESLNVVKVRMARLDALRMQVDSRRRRVHRRFLRAIRNLSAGEAAALQAQTSELTTGRGGASALGPEGEVLPGEPASGLVGPGATSARMPGTNEAYTYGIDTDSDEEADWEHMRNREDYAREAISQHRKLEAVAESYREQEQLVFEQLSGLVRDAAYFKSYVASSFLVVKDTLVATLVSLGACKRPLPGFSERESAEGGALYGRIADIQDLVVQLPPVVKAGGRQLPFGRNSALVSPQQVHPTRITAQPLQVAADDVSAPQSRYSPVPAVVKPASQVARDQLHDGSGVAAEPEGPYTAEPYPERGAYETTGTYESAAGQRSFGSPAMPAGVTPYPTYVASPAGGHPVGGHITGSTPYPTYVASTGDAGPYQESMGAQPTQGAYAAMQGELAAR